ncbi:ARL6 [Symbiodinium necroappetens]|uniref:ARL6 protein n=1 Tax=Symbiodinium necroappetens TaxID=1628268 RepID=A0A813A3F9_9DINO|nr:ARL6 [Symbiodinium necroappetens]
MLADPRIAEKKMPILHGFLNNKVDQPAASPPQETMQALVLDRITDRPWQLFSCDALKGDGVEEVGLPLLTSELRSETDVKVRHPSGPDLRMPGSEAAAEDRTLHAGTSLLVEFVMKEVSASRLQRSPKEYPCDTHRYRCDLCPLPMDTSPTDRTVGCHQMLHASRSEHQPERCLHPASGMVEPDKEAQKQSRGAGKAQGTSPAAPLQEGDAAAGSGKDTSAEGDAAAGCEAVWATVEAVGPFFRAYPGQPGHSEAEAAGGHGAAEAIWPAAEAGRSIGWQKSSWTSNLHLSVLRTALVVAVTMLWRSSAGESVTCTSWTTAAPAECERKSDGGSSMGVRRSSPSGYLGFCMGPKESVAKAVQQPNLGLCGVQIQSGRDQDHEFKVLRLPRCGQCSAPEFEPNIETELSFSSSDKAVGSSKSILQRNIMVAKAVISDIYRDLESRCVTEQRQYEDSGSSPSQQKFNVWATYTNKARLQHFAAESLAFVQRNAECRSRLLNAKQLRFLIMLQHLLSEDCSDANRPEALRKHQDTFEGILTDSVSSQLVEDAHRCEFSIDGTSFSLQDLPHIDAGLEERKHRIVQFQTELVQALETFLLGFCSRRGLSAGGTKRLMQAVTTQMSQAGVANIDRGSQASRYFVGSQGLDQRTAYNLSTMMSPSGEALKLSILCMRTGFTQYLDKDELLKLAGVQYPRRCKPESYLYQYATLCFFVGAQVDNCESINCTVLDALDEANISPALAEDEEEVILDEARQQVT